MKKTINIFLASIALLTISCNDNNDDVSSINKVAKSNAQSNNFIESLRPLTATEKSTIDKFYNSLSNEGETAQSASSSKIVGKIARNTPPNTIDVVFHFMFNRNFNRSHINGSPWSTAQEEVRILNQNYAWKRESNNNGIPAYWQNRDARINLRFNLSQVTTTWVGNGYQAENNGNGVFNNAGRAMIDANSKLNIYVVPERSFLMGGNPILGSAERPWIIHNRDLDGDPAHVILSQGTFNKWFENSIDINRLNTGKVIVHEVGHFLGLNHTFSNNGLCTNDGIWDTPIQSEASLISNNVRPTLVNGVPTINNCGHRIMFQNHMDYSPDASRVMFTKGQRAAVMNILENFPNRSRYIR